MIIPNGPAWCKRMDPELGADQRTGLNVSPPARQPADHRREGDTQICAGTNLDLLSATRGANPRLDGRVQIVPPPTPGASGTTAFTAITAIGSPRRNHIEMRYPELRQLSGPK